jgi:hypothetical protein
VHEDSDNAGEPSLVSVRTMEIVVALLLLGASTIVIMDSLRIGIGWKPAEGPAAGSFPFVVGAMLAVASLMNLLAAVRQSPGYRESFASRPAFLRVLTIFLPTVLYVGLIHVLGIYVASALFIAMFMLAFGREAAWKAIVVGIAVPLLLFFMFERWFLVPLPKGPLEAMLGYA